MHKVGPALTSVEDHSRPNWAVLVMSGLPPVATVERTSRFGSFVPLTDSCTTANGIFIRSPRRRGRANGLPICWRQADGPIRKPGHIGITRQSHLLIDKNRAQPIDARCGTQRARNDRWCPALRHRFSDHPPNQFALVWNLETENERGGLAE